MICSDESDVNIMIGCLVLDACVICSDESDGSNMICSSELDTIARIHLGGSDSSVVFRAGE